MGILREAQTNRAAIISWVAKVGNSEGSKVGRSWTHLAVSGN